MIPCFSLNIPSNQMSFSATQTNVQMHSEMFHSQHLPCQNCPSPASCAGQSLQWSVLTALGALAVPGPVLPSLTLWETPPSLCPPLESPRRCLVALQHTSKHSNKLLDMSRKSPGHPQVLCLRDLKGYFKRMEVWWPSLNTLTAPTLVSIQRKLLRLLQWLFFSSLETTLQTPWSVFLFCGRNL